MAEVYVLRSGALKEAEHGWVRAPASITLVRYEDLNNRERHLLVDAGGPNDSMADLEVRLLPYVRPEDVHEIVLTHNHPDHTGLLRFFHGATVFGSDSMYYIDGTDETAHMYHALPEPLEFGRDVRVIRAPGHENSKDQTVVVLTAEGRVAIVGDLFLNRQEYEIPDTWMWPTDNENIAFRSRMDVINNIKPQRVIPGHGEPFSVE